LLLIIRKLSNTCGISIFFPISSPPSFPILILFLFPYSLLYSYVECTSAAIQALSTFRKLYPRHRREEIQRCIDKAAAFIEKIQASDGSWFAPPYGKPLF
jgi:hypothetical protein